VLGQVVTEADINWLGDWTDFLNLPITKLGCYFFGSFSLGGLTLLQYSHSSFGTCHRINGFSYIRLRRIRKFGTCLRWLKFCPIALGIPTNIPTTNSLIY